MPRAQEAVLNPRTMKIRMIKRNAATSRPDVPNSSAIPVPGKAVEVGFAVAALVGVPRVACAPEVANAPDVADAPVVANASEVANA